MILLSAIILLNIKKSKEKTSIFVVNGIVIYLCTLFFAVLFLTIIGTSL